MKKFISIALISVVGIANAADISVATINDADRTGFAVGTNVKGFNISASHIDRVYDRYSVGKQFDITKIGPVQVTAGGAGVYQNTLAGNDNGYGVSANATATAAVHKNIDVVAGVQKFWGQDRVSAQNGNSTTLGIKFKF